MVSTPRPYLSGFGNEFASEAIEGALPRDQNSPQRHPLGLYIEQLTGTSFSAPRGVSRSIWTYRIRPAAMHKPFRPIDSRLVRSGPFTEVPPTPNQLRWRPMPIPSAPTDFIDGLTTLGGNGSPVQQDGAAIHVYAANRSMVDRFFYDADGELLIVPQLGPLVVHTELGVIEVTPGEICLVPRGVRFRVELVDGQARGYVLENYGQHLRLPELGPIGTFGLANSRDFLAPAAAFEDREGDFRLVAKYGGGLWEAEIDHSPLDIVAWRGNYVPSKYDLNRFQCLNTVTFDHPDPSIYCVLASPTATPGVANVEVGCFPPRWSVAEHTFRPPPFHRNVASEFLGLVSGQYIGKGDSFAPGSASLHNCMSGHGPDAEAYERGTNSDLKPQYLADTMVFLFETRLPVCPTRFALETDMLEADYYTHWQGLPKRFQGMRSKGYRLRAKAVEVTAGDLQFGTDDRRPRRRQAFSPWPFALSPREETQMKRMLVLGTIMLSGAMMAAVAAQQAPAGGQGRGGGGGGFPPIAPIEKVAGNVYMVTGEGGNTAVFVAQNGVVLVDTKLANNGQAILDQVRKVTDKPITHIINTHTHGDHTGSNQYFPASVEIVAQENTAANMKRMPVFQEPANAQGLPDTTFKDKKTLLSGKDAIDLYYFGAAHTNGDAFVVFRDAKVMHSGDAFANKGQGLVDTSNGGSGAAYADTITKAGKTINNITTVIPGHAPLMTWQDFLDYGEFQRLFLAHAQASMKAGRTPEEAMKTFALPEKFKGYNLAGGRGGPAGNFGVIYQELQKK